MTKKILTCKELRELLKQYPDDARVVVQGYEDGYDGVIGIRPLNVVKAKVTKWYYGVFDEAQDDTAEKVLLLGSTRQ